MEIHWTARRVRLTPAAQRRLDERLSRLGRYVRELQDENATAHVKLSGEKRGVQAEILMRVRHEDLVAREVGDDPQSALDGAADRLEHQLKKLKERKSRKVAARRAAKAPIPRSAAQIALGVTARRGSKPKRERSETGVVRVRRSTPANDGRPRVVRARAGAVLSLDEAVDRLSESGEAALAFTDRESGRSSVLYRRRDGQLALLESARD